MRKVFIFLFVAVTTVVYGQNKSPSAYVELLRSDVRAQKVALITEVMEFTDAQSSSFWPLQREYELELSKIGDEKLKLIKAYAMHYDRMTDEKATVLVKKLFQLQESRLALKKKYFEKIGKALSPVVAAKFIQLENVINNIIDIQIATELPLIEHSDVAEKK